MLKLSILSCCEKLPDEKRVMCFLNGRVNFKIACVGNLTAVEFSTLLIQSVHKDIKADLGISVAFGDRLLVRRVVSGCPNLLEHKLKFPADRGLDKKEEETYNHRLMVVNGFFSVLLVLKCLLTRYKYAIGLGSKKRASMAGTNLSSTNSSPCFS